VHSFLVVTWLHSNCEWLRICSVVIYSCFLNYI